MYSGEVSPVAIHGPHHAAMFCATVLRSVSTSVAFAGSSGALAGSGAFHTLSGAKSRGLAGGGAGVGAAGSAVVAGTRPRRVAIRSDTTERLRTATARSAT